MASIQQKGDAFYCQFIFKGKRHTITIGKVSRDEANTFSGKVAYLLMRIKQRFVTLPPGVNIDEFILHDGAPPEPAVMASERLTFAHFWFFRVKHP